MPPASDDLPRSPSGRVPQWVVDDAAGVHVDPPGWRAAPSPPPQRPRRRWRALGPVILIGMAVLGGAWWANGSFGLPEGLGSLLGQTPGVEQRAPVEPSPDAIAFADEAYLSDEGRRLFYDTRPEFLGAAEFAGRCVDQGVPRVRADGAVGCYSGAANTIVMYVPADPRLRGFAVETAAHETLHAAWVRLTEAERADLTGLLEAEMARMPADATIHEQVAGSVGEHPENRATELFAYIGTQVWRDGGLDPRIEAVYGRFITDRAALVAVHTGWRSMLDGMAADIQAASQALAEQEAAAAQDRAQHTADAEGVEVYRQQYEAKRAEVAAMPADQRERLQLSWVWWDGTDLPMAPADRTLAKAAALLARDDAELPARDAAIRAAEDAAAAERARVQAMVDDLNALQRQLDPASLAG